MPNRQVPFRAPYQSTQETVTPSPLRDLPPALEPTQLPEPAQRQFHLSSFELMHAHEMFHPYSLEAGGPHVCCRFAFQGRRRDDVIHPAADPDRDVQEIGAGLIRFV